jgi:uncharacterized membrane protein
MYSHLGPASDITPGHGLIHSGLGSGPARFRPDTPDDRVLARRVKASVRSVVSGRRLHVDTRDGVVTLRGSAGAAEAPRLLDAVRAVRGVRLVDNQLQVRAGRTTGRGLAGAAGVALAAYTALRNGAGARALLLAGAGLSLLSVPRRRRHPGPLHQRSIEVDGTIHVDAPIDAVFAFAADPVNFPRFLSLVLDVRPTGPGNRARWIVQGAAGFPADFATEVSRRRGDRVIEWRTVPGTPLDHAGSIRCAEASDNRTRVHLRMAYRMPAGRQPAGGFGIDARRTVAQDLARLKTQVEADANQAS